MRKIIKGTALTLVIIIIFSITCFADMTGGNGKVIPSVTVNIPAKHVMGGDKYTGKDRFTFILRSEDANCPMPAGSDGREKSVTIGAGEKIDFGDITFDHPDAYYYTVARAEKTYKGIRTDDSAYRVMIAALNDGTYEMVITDKKDKKTDEIIYKDIYKASSPKTGDDLLRKMILPACAGVLALAAIIVMMLWRKEERDV